MTGKANAPNWKKIKADYLTGKSIKSIAEKYGVSVSAINSRRTREGWASDKADITSRARQKCVEKIADSESSRMAQMANLFDDFGIAAMRHIARTLAELSQDGSVTRISEESAGRTRVKDLTELVKNAATLGKSFGLDAESKREQEKIRMERGNSEPRAPKILYHSNGDIEVCDG